VRNHGERNLWERLRINMVGRWQAPVRHEDVAGVGVADTSFVCGGRHQWMELKFRDRWPARATTKVVIESLTPDQVNWLEMKGRAGGDVWLLLQVDETVLLYDWTAVRRIEEGLLRPQLERLARRRWLKILKYRTLAAEFEAGCGNELEVRHGYQSTSE
jgi:hypothetical protein